MKLSTKALRRATALLGIAVLTLACGGSGGPDAVATSPATAEVGADAAADARLDARADAGARPGVSGKAGVDGGVCPAPAKITPFGTATRTVGDGTPASCTGRHLPSRARGTLSPPSPPRRLSVFSMFSVSPIRPDFATRECLPRTESRQLSAARHLCPCDRAHCPNHLEA
jgi:hypothetical protein